jgi:hypothetical protein
MSKSIKLIIEMCRENDGSYSLSIENPDYVEESRYLDGISEGYVFDIGEIIEEASFLVKRCLHDIQDNIAAPTEKAV